MPAFSSMLKDEYANLFNTCVPNKGSINTVNKVLDKMLTGKLHYEIVSRELGIPWYFIGLIHTMESNCNFATHLHNGDPLNARTVHVPKGRPTVGTPPFTWEASAKDALMYEGFAEQSDWSIPVMLYRLEKYNGFGYRNLKQCLRTPYLWSMSNHYTSGKFLEEKDASGKWRGVFHPEAVSKQCGAAVLLKQLINLKLID